MIICIEKEILYYKKPLFLLNLTNDINKNPLPASILWIESLFRPKWFRYFEYIYWKWCLLTKSSRAKSLTIGIAQMRYDLWLKFSILYDYKPCIHNFEDPKINYEAVSWYLSYFKYNNTIDISQIYTGQKSYYYSRLIDKALNHINYKGSE